MMTICFWETCASKKITLSSKSLSMRAAVTFSSRRDSTSFAQTPKLLRFRRGSTWDNTGSKTSATLTPTGLQNRMKANARTSSHYSSCLPHWRQQLPPSSEEKSLGNQWPCLSRRVGRDDLQSYPVILHLLQSTSWWPPQTISKYLPCHSTNFGSPKWGQHI